MRVLSATVVDGHLDLPEGSLRNGEAVTVLIAEPEESFALTPDQKAELLEAIGEAERGETVDGWKLLEEIKG